MKIYIYYILKKIIVTNDQIRCSSLLTINDCHNVETYMIHIK